MRGTSIPNETSHSYGEAAIGDNHDDATLLRACRRGDTSAFECLVRRHQGMLFNIALRVSGNHEDACEIVQDAFLSAWRKLDGFRGDSSFSTWLVAIAINLSRDRRRRRGDGRQVAVSLDAPRGEGDDLPHFDAPDHRPTPLQQLEEAELRRTLEGCIDALPGEFREVLVLRDMQDLSYGDMTRMLGIREGTVKSRISRAREAVRDCLRKRWSRR